MTNKNKQDELNRRKEMLLSLVEDPIYVPMKEKELAMFLQVKPEERDALKEVLDLLVLEGKLRLTGKNKYVKGDGSVMIGTFISNARGFGFVEVEGLTEDLFVPAQNVHSAMHLDTVQVSVKNGKSGKRKEAEVLQIIARGFTEVVGTFQASRNYGFVIPDHAKFSADIFIPKEFCNGAVDGHKVVCKITDYGESGERGRSPEGKITEILGHVSDPGVDILAIIKGHNIPTEFSEKQLQQAKNVAKPVSDADCFGREDLRSMQMVTIDGEDAKDLDDAVSLTVENGIYHLGVHIADVTNYVQEHSALDWEALERGTSVYLVDRVVPMLPHILSNGMCSLNAGEDRLALSCLMDIDEQGNLKDYRIVESVIRVDRRMSYTAVAGILDREDPALCVEYAEHVEMFKQMHKLSQIIREKRYKRGATDFDFPESKIYLDEEGHPLEILPYERNCATMLIEDFMLMANETVAQHFYWMSVPFLYRTHDKPDPDRIKKLGVFVSGLGFHMKGNLDDIHPKEIQKLLGSVADTPYEALVSRMALRSMKQAKYSAECTGHFGLACTYYSHFTSPIRRYPDLQIHRIIKEQLRGKLNEDRLAHYAEILPEIAKQTSMLERRAEEAERACDKLKKAEYMANHIGEEFTGVVSGITGYGIYVELDNTVEGMIAVEVLPPDEYTYEESRYALEGRNPKNRFTLGQTLNVCVRRVDTFMHTIDFDLCTGD